LQTAETKGSIRQEVRRRSLLRDTVFRATHEPSGIEQVEWPELSNGPAGARIELDAYKVADLTISAVTDVPLQSPSGVQDLERGLQSDRLVHL
jgi:hypothetical protein